MKKIVITIALNIFLVMYSNAQSFEGLIEYSNSYQSKVANYPSENLDKLMGTKQAYVIKGNNYKAAYNGVFLKSQLYKGNENRGYSLTAKSDTLYWEDYSINNDKALSYEIKKKQDTILGIPCDVIIVKSEKSKTYYYYNSKYGVNSELFKQHNYGNWYYIISKTKALPLKTVFENNQYIMTSVATKITPMKLEDSIFEIQDKSKIAKATW